MVTTHEQTALRHLDLAEQAAKWADDSHERGHDLGVVVAHTQRAAMHYQAVTVHLAMARSVQHVYELKREG